MHQGGPVPVSIDPFLPSFDQSQLDDLKTRLALTRLPEAETVDDWEQGIPLAYVRELLDYWRDSYDWRRCEAEMARWPHFRAEVEGLPIHFIHVQSPRADARPLIITHGWPGSFLELTGCIGPLTDPEAHGAPGAPAFHLVLPSLPGFAFSGKPSQAGWSIEKTAEAWDILMRGLGYDRYFAQGGDWGAGVTMAIGAQDRGACAAIHVNMPVAQPPAEVMADPTPYEAEALARLGWYRASDNGYAIIQTANTGLRPDRFSSWADGVDRREVPRLERLRRAS
jgi:epoxide hydrolase